MALRIAIRWAALLILAVAIQPACARNPRGGALGTFTSTQVIADFPPASNSGLTLYTSDMGPMHCDGVRWLVTGTPPQPPGAAALGYNTNVYTVFPVTADIGYTNSPGAYRLYSGWGVYAPPAPTSSAYTTAGNGQLQIIYPTGGSNAGLLTTMPYASSVHWADNEGMLPFVVGGWYWEAAITESNNDSDNADAFFIEPQEHNTANDDYNTAIATAYHQWNEFDITESGHGTDQGGNYRGAYIQWGGAFANATTVAAAYTTGTTSISFSSGWSGETGSNWPIKFNTGEIRNATLTRGSTGPYTIAALSSNETTAVTTSWTTLVNLSNHKTSFLDYTVEHIFGAAYDPVGQTYSVYLDGVLQATLSTANANSSNTFRDSLHYFPQFFSHSHGLGNAHTMNLRYFALWTP